jgi:hypothetical protein
MQEPNASSLWNQTFAIDTRFYYVTEPISFEEIAQLCTDMVRIASAKPVKTPYFVVLFEDCKVLLIFSPAKGIFNGFMKMRLTPVLEDVRQTIAQLALELIAKDIRNG